VKADDDYDKDLVMWNGSWIRAPKVWSNLLTFSNFLLKM
jgi:hypothetical protein